MTKSNSEPSETPDAAWISEGTERALITLDEYMSILMRLEMLEKRVDRCFSSSLFTTGVVIE